MKRKVFIPLILLLMVLQALTGCRQIDGSSSASSEAFSSPQHRVQQMEHATVANMINRIVLSKENVPAFLTSDHRLIAIPASVEKIYNAFSVGGYVAMSEGGQLEYWLFTQQGALSREVLLEDHPVASVALIMERDYTKNILAVETNGDVWQLRFKDTDHGIEFAEPPQRMAGLSDIVAVSAGQLNAALDQEGKVWCWGLDATGVSGEDEYAGVLIDTPAAVADLPPMTQIIGDQQTIYALDEQGNLWLQGLDKFGFIDMPAERYAAEVVGPGHTWYYPLYSWTMIDKVDRIDEITLVSQYCLRMRSRDKEMYWRIDDDFDDPRYRREQSDANNEIIISRRGRPEGCYFSAQHLPEDARLFYDPRQVTFPREPDWADYWADSSRQIIAYANGDIEWSSHSGISASAHIPGARNIYIDPYTLDHEIYIADKDQQLWVFFVR